MTRYIKDPDAALDYASAWPSWLAEDETITDHAVTVEDGLTLGTHAVNASEVVLPILGGTLTCPPGTAVTAWLSGGEVGSDYRVTFHIETSQGREDDRTVTIRVRER